jgi:hypothetical protein
MGMKRLVVMALAFCFCGAAVAQLRSLPANAKRGEMRHIQDMIIEIDGTPQRLAPGAQIRDASNLIIAPAALPPASRVKYELDADGMVRRVWILTDAEAAKD